MKLRARIFAVSFSVSAVLLGAAAVALTAFASAPDEAGLAGLEASAGALAAMASAAADGEPVDADAMLSALAPIRRDIARRSVLERDSAAVAAVGWGTFLAAEAIAALAVSAVAAAALTSRWSRLRDGILSIRRGGSSGPFFRGARDEFGAVEEELDGLVAALGDRERMRSELRALQGWGEASAFLAHQARTPLASLSLSAKAAMAALEACPAGTAVPDPVGEARAAMERAGSEAARIASLFSRVRSLSGFKDPAPEDLDPADAFLEAAAALAARGSPTSGEALVVERNDRGPKPRFDRGYLVEAFTNLLANSVEACAERGIPLRARLRLASAPGEYTITYDDSVAGLDPALASRVGAARFTTKPNGTGLGVWLAGRVAALHGGRMDISMTEPGGLRFAMRFPVEGEA